MNEENEPPKPESPDDPSNESESEEISNEPEQIDAAGYQPTFLSKWLPIPKIFHSVEKDKMFVECIQCGRNLIESGEQYVIEKVFRRLRNDQQTIEPIIEMAMCLDCREDKGESMSEDSATALKSHFESRVDFGRRLVDLSLNSQDDESIDPWLERCLLNGKPQNDMREFQVVALCHGKKLLRDFFPIMISGEAVEEISELLSDQTRGWMDDFIGDNFGMPSEFIQPPTFTPVLI